MKPLRQLPQQKDIRRAKRAIEELALSNSSLSPICCEFDQWEDPLSWVSKSHDKTRFFWSDRETNIGIGGIGISDVIGKKETLRRVRKRSEMGQRRYFGGFLFGGEFGQLWAPLWWTDGKKLVYNPPFPTHDALINPLPFTSESKPNQKEWMSMMEKAIDQLHSGSIDKIVLARQQKISVILDAFDCLKTLMTDQTRAYSFAFQPGGDSIFIGRSPERLFYMNQDTLKTEAIAGTRSIDIVDGDNELLNSDKDRREHALVVDGIVASLKSLGLSANAERSPTVIKSGNLIHLKTHIECDVSENIRPEQILDVLHPTAAVCGSPTREAYRLIAELEPFDRGWFAGPIGWCDHRAAEFAVAIRSATFKDDKAIVYAGAGIVKGSDPLLEWSEIAAKGSQYLKFRTDK